MFDVFCPAHSGRILLGPSAIVGLANTGQEMVLQWRCPCGGTGAERFSHPDHHDTHAAAAPRSAA